MKTLLQKLDEIPPFFVYALARKRKRQRPSLDEMVKLSGIPVRSFTRLAGKFSWENVKAGDIDKFCRACGVDLLRQNRERDYLRHTLTFKRPFSHLSAKQLKTFNQQCQEWQRRKAATA